MENEADHLAFLKTLIQHHEVCWDRLPVESKPIEGDAIVVGYELVIAGVFNDPERAADAFQDKADTVLKALRQIASDLQQHAFDPRDHRVKVFDAGLQQTSGRQFRSEASLKVAVLHREGFHIPADEKLKANVLLMEERLKELGACKGAWKPR